MIPEKIKALFEFIDYLDKRKNEFVEKFIPICKELEELDTLRAKLKPHHNYIDKQRYDSIQRQIAEKFSPIENELYLPVLNKLKELAIWNGDDVQTSIWNGNIDAIEEIKRTFVVEDVPEIMRYKKKYLGFRSETNSNFLCLQLTFSNLDEILKALFDFFKDTSDNEFDGFETKTVSVHDIEEAVEKFKNSKNKNIRFSFTDGYFLTSPKEGLTKPTSTTINNKIIMGDNFQIGDINNNNGQIAIGSNIRISHTSSEKKETAEKISNLNELIRNEQNIDENQKELLIRNFNSVKEEILLAQPSKSKIFQWLKATKDALKNLVTTKDIFEAINWVYENFEFLTKRF